MKTTFALVFCISVILLMYLSGAINKEKPQLLALAPVSLFDRIDCREDCADAKVVGVIPEGQMISVLQSIKGKSNTVLRVESGEGENNVAGWATFNKDIMQSPEASDAEAQNK